MAKHENSIDRLVIDRIQAQEPGSVFTSADFADLGSAAAIHQALSRNARSGVIRKLARGLYDRPRIDSALGALPPSLDEVVRALKAKAASRLQPSGAQAANLLGISDQVPLQAVFLTDGSTRRIRLGRRSLLLKRTTPRNLATAGTTSGTVIQALRWIGRENVDDRIIAKLRRRLDAREKKHLIESLRYAPQWMANILRRVAGAAPHEESAP